MPFTYTAPTPFCPLRVRIVHCHSSPSDASEQNVFYIALGMHVYMSSQSCPHGSVTFCIMVFRTIRQ